MTATAAVQDHYPADFAHCYGCGPAQLPTGSRSRAGGRATRWSRASSRGPSIAIPGFVYGGLIASLNRLPRDGDRRGRRRAREGFEIGAREAPRCEFTGSLRSSTSSRRRSAPSSELRARVREGGSGRRVEVTLAAAGAITPAARCRGARCPTDMRARGGPERDPGGWARRAASLMLRGRCPPRRTHAPLTPPHRRSFDPEAPTSRGSPTRSRSSIPTRDWAALRRHGPALRANLTFGPLVVEGDAPLDRGIRGRPSHDPASERLIPGSRRPARLSSRPSRGGARRRRGRRRSR